MHVMCGADLSDLEEEKTRDMEGRTGKKPDKDKGKDKP